MVEPVDHEDWFINIAGEFGLLAESIASLRLSSGQVGEAQHGFYLGRVVLGIDHLHGATQAWRDDIDRYMEEMKKVDEVENELDDDWMAIEPIRGDEDRVRLGHGHKTFPYDLPVTIEVCRIMDDVEDREGKKVRTLVGWGLKITTTIKPSVEFVIGIERDPATITLEASPAFSDYQTQDGMKVWWVGDAPIRPAVDPRADDGTHDAASPQNRRGNDVQYKSPTPDTLGDDDDPIIDDDEPDFIAEDQDDDIIMDDDDDIIEED